MHDPIKHHGSLCCNGRSPRGAWGTSLDFFSTHSSNQRLVLPCLMNAFGCLFPSFFQCLLLMTLALFAMAPVICSCLLSLMYSLYLFMAYEESTLHHAQEFENRFWTIFGLLLSTALFFAQDSPLAFGRHWSPSLGFVCVLLAGYLMHIWDRHHHRMAISQ